MPKGAKRKNIKLKMHRRNVFRTPPDYTDLAIKYKDFRRVCKLELTGKVSIDYKNEATLRVLTHMLLQEYFQLDVNFAPGSLIPALPLRLNYILWMEDCLALLKNDGRHVNGIDIGCGSSCIYSLLGAKKNAWHMYALESDETNVEFAKENVERNSLQHLVTVVPQKNPKLIFEQFFSDTAAETEAEKEIENNENSSSNGEHPLNGYNDNKSIDENKTNGIPSNLSGTLPTTAIQSTVFQFCLCNPPFYDSTLPNPFESTTRNLGRRPPPNNCHTGTASELLCEGGEVQFVKQIIDESIRYKDRVSIFTSMLGHKTSLQRILRILVNHGITNYISTEFHQGNTTRWGVAWSFKKDFALANISNDN